MAVELLPLLSVTVNTTVFGPTSRQVKLVISRLSEAMPQASDEPLSIAVGVMLALPVESN